MSSLVLVMPFLHLVNLVLFRFTILFCRPSFRSRFLGRALTINKPLWVLIVVVIWSTYDALWAVLKDTDWAFWWTTFTADPCFVDADFTRWLIMNKLMTCYTLHNFLCGAVSLQRYNKYLISMTCIGSISHPHGESHVDPGRCVCCQCELMKNCCNSSSQLQCMHFTLLLALCL